MRSLMSSNPFNSARESLHTLFDENRKKVMREETLLDIVYLQKQREYGKLGITVLEDHKI